ncbi:hypothetical protein [Halopiger aswanensis]|uniref:Uncharacterized protein n=1 Tax=Halopiger aswanensis TaxID=148449 RepID=A0A419WDY5_9EURY|nr:hypothetical protein [Halopiger aswanensis]RKD93612.1 hypothetical protein ATJ93_3242 [Halopiger aswanensis]
MASSDTGTDGDGGSDADGDAVSARSPGRTLAVVAVLALLCSSVLVRASAVVDATTAVIGSVVLAIVGLALVGLSSRSAGDARASGQGEADAAANPDADETAADDGNIWNAIPSWQYDGRHVESGGLARDEQTRALQEIQDEADELAGSDDPSRNS